MDFNIPYLDANPAACAAVYHDDLVRTLISDVTVIISMLRRRWQPNSLCDAELLPKFHEDRDYRQWLEKSPKNEEWMASLLNSLHKEYEMRFKKPHPMKDLFKTLKQTNPYSGYPNAAFSQLPCKIPTKFHLDHNKKPFTYTDRTTPTMIQQNLSVMNSYRLWYIQEADGRKITYPLAQLPTWFTESLIFRSESPSTPSMASAAGF